MGFGGVNMWSLLIVVASSFAADGPKSLSTFESVWQPVVSVEGLETGEIDVDDILENVASQAPFGTTSIEPMVREGEHLIPLELYLPPSVSHPSPPSPEPERPITYAGQADGTLSGKALYLSQCHGFQYIESWDAYTTHRGNLFDTVEDFHNPEGMNFYLSAYLENACLLYTSPSPRDGLLSRMPSSA